ncbi:hypothetical protein L9F63_024692, partial [Diploptera punctata]
YIQYNSLNCTYQLLYIIYFNFLQPIIGLILNSLKKVLQFLFVWVTYHNCTAKILFVGSCRIDLLDHVKLDLKCNVKFYNVGAPYNLSYKMLFLHFRHALIFVYGITTGFGKFARTVIDSDKLEELQYNLIRSHAAGVGTPLNPEKTRMLLALRINVLAKGHSGISLHVLHNLIKAFNASCLSWVPEQGSVGASGDLAPLAHLALGLLGEGKMWSPETGWGDAKDVLTVHRLTPMRLGPKEGIALINGTQLITSLGAEAVERSYYIARQADVVAALTLEVLKGTSRAFDSDVQMIRPHKGQIAVAKRLRALLHSETYPSQIAESHRFCNRVQDAYTLRCCPQVHGIVHDTIDFVQGIITVEMNSGTDNPPTALNSHNRHISMTARHSNTLK